jgi:uncharacterized damage-inducible protein DinB
MSYADLILPEFNQEMANTRKVLELVPDDKFDWSAGHGMQTIGWNANHLSEIPGWVEGTLTMPSWDINPPDGPKYESPTAKTRQQVLETFDKNVAAAQRAIAAVKDEDLDQVWSLLYGGNVVFSIPRRDVIRSFVINHTIHHRAHLLVYLRLNDIQTPGMYSPSNG